jgi:cytochrome c553
MAQQVQSLAEDVEAAVSAAMGKALPSEVADEDPLVPRKVTSCNTCHRARLSILDAAYASGSNRSPARHLCA